MASYTFDINLVVFKNYICAFYIDFRLCLSCFLGCIKIFVCVPYFGNFRRIAARIRRYIHFQNVDVPLFWIFVVRHLITWLLHMRVILPPHSKFHLNGTTCSCVIAKKWFSMRRPSAILNLWISDFLSFPSPQLACGKICVCILNFVQLGRFAAEILRYNDFQNGGSPSCWIFEFLYFHHLGLIFVCVRLSLRTPNFVLIGQYGAEL